MTANRSGPLRVKKVNCSIRCFLLFPQQRTSRPWLCQPWAHNLAILDFVFPDTRGQRPADFETTLKFGIALTRLAAEDPDVHKLTVEVQHLLRPRSVYRDPALVQRVLAKMAEA